MSGNKNKHSYIQTYGSNNNFKTNSRFTRSKKLPQRLWMHYMPMNAEQTLGSVSLVPHASHLFYHWKHHNYRFRHNHSHGTTSHWEDNLIIFTLSLSLSLATATERHIMCEYADIIYYNESDLDSPIPNVYIYVVWTASYSSVMPTLSMIHFKSDFLALRWILDDSIARLNIGNSQRYYVTVFAYDIF